MWQSKATQMKRMKAKDRKDRLKGFKDTSNENLSPEQKHALESIKAGRNVFITGSAGVGKSFLLNEIIRCLPSSVSLTASTGVAACNIGGTTLHSFASIGLGEKSAAELGHTIKYKRYKAEAKERWLKCQVLVIDEVSMIDGNLFTKIDQVARIVRSCDYPFGGIQVILCGDFLQLPPVHAKRFAFETQTWKDLIHETIVLKKVFRQKLIGFVALLNRLRLGRITSRDIEVLHLCNSTVFPNDGIKPTKLYPHRYKCEEENNRELRNLSGEIHTFSCQDWARNEAYLDQLHKNSKYMKVLELKVGAQVMLLCNKDVVSGLVNGARGVVVGFYSRKMRKDSDEESDDENDNILKYPIVRFVNGIEIEIPTHQSTIASGGVVVAYRNQLPLALAWAVSIHKSQGMTLERIDINIAKAFEHGQAYVALSRVTSLDGLRLRAFDPSKITAHPSVIYYYQQIDPSLDKCAKAGEDDLNKFIELRRNPQKYKEHLKSLFPIKCASDTDLEHNYFQLEPGSISPISQEVKLLRIEEQNVVRSPGKSRYEAVDGVCKKVQSCSDNTTDIKSDITSSPDLTKLPALRKEMRTTCRSALSEMHATNTPERPFDSSSKKSSAIVDVITIDSDPEHVCEEKPSTSSATIVQKSTRIRKRKSITKRDPNLTVVEESDADENLSDIEHFDDSYFEESVTNTPQLPALSNSKQRPNFLSNICPDLLGISEKRQKVEGSASTSKVENEARIKALLKEKEELIKEKRNKALEKRLNSLKRRSFVK